MKILLLDRLNNKEYLIDKNLFSIGRNKVNDLVINTPIVSRKHCQIVYLEKKYFIVDFNSENGTYVNSKKVKQPLELFNDDIITISTNGPMYQIKVIHEDNSNIDINTNENVIKDTHHKFSKFFLTLIISFLTSLLLLAIILLFVISNIKNNKEKYYIEKKIDNIMQKYGEKNFRLDDYMVKRINYYIKVYKNSETLKTGLENREKYIKMIEEIFLRNNIPVDLSYIAFVESNYNIKAYNAYSGARGMWQLMPNTARQYGLIVNKKKDERLDPKKSTEAAAKYINDLLAVFGVNSFTLAIAAYNAGDGLLRGSLTRIEDPTKHRNFLYLYKKNLIPDETKEYVLKVLALMIICEEIAEERQKEKKASP